MRTGARIVSLAVFLFCALAGAAFAEKINVEVQSAKVERDPKTSEMLVSIELKAAGHNVLEAFTSRHVGRNVEVRLGQTTLLKARLREKISAGIIVATTKFTDDEAKQVAAQLVAGALIEIENVAD